MDNERLRKMYSDALERAKGYMDDPKLYDAHRYYCLQFAELLGIDKSAVFKELDEEAKRRMIRGDSVRK